MKIGIVSDSHGRQETVRRALALLRGRGAELIIHCGDIDDPETVRLFAGLPTHFVFGNCDARRADLHRAMRDTGATCHDAWGYLELAGKKVAWTHGDDKARLRDLETGGAFDYVFYGHTHVAEQHQTGPTRVVNPGALHRARPKTFGVLNLVTGEWETLTVDPD